MANIVKVVDMSHIECDMSASWGKIVNVYTSYANAVAHADTGLATIYEINGITGAVGDAIVQKGKNSTSTQVGLTINENGRIQFACASGKYYLAVYAGRSGTPITIDVVADVEESSSSSSAEESSSSSSAEESSSSSSASASASSSSSSSAV